ncbi:MAG: UbiX family flavin prenyltransferase [Pseudomonadales bacterium]|nr:UbiX family flavin prenyltransferase [Pseudomonadales bacterium]MDP6471285.1 UbiX family flavin prenyltransferase [Pseudomonadales bacterium]MDP6825526.1 UbiX family flavin prenyltransferase [Pseudomonadales bacterium]MDP6971584.1 UbiX family flavin prenyltransferase [Pseudomonadales bacterium]
MKRLIVGMTGATGSILGVRLLEVLSETTVETHLVVSKWAQHTLTHETSLTLEHVRGLASETHSPGDMGARVSSGSFHTDGMVVVPCSVRTVAAIAQGNGDHLVHRAADVILKERRKLVLVARETPLSDIHLENMLKLSRMGATILPPMPAFYNQPETLGDIVDHIIMRILDQFDITVDLVERWDGKVKNLKSVRSGQTNARSGRSITK